MYLVEGCPRLSPGKIYGSAIALSAGQDFDFYSNLFLYLY
jgi:hypothetical protein